MSMSTSGQSPADKPDLIVLRPPSSGSSTISRVEASGVEVEASTNDLAAKQ